MDEGLSTEEPIKRDEKQAHESLTLTIRDYCACSTLPPEHILLTKAHLNIH